MEWVIYTVVVVEMDCQLPFFVEQIVTATHSRNRGTWTTDLGLCQLKENVITKEVVTNSFSSSHVDGCN